MKTSAVEVVVKIIIANEFSRKKLNITGQVGYNISK